MKLRLWRWVDIFFTSPAWAYTTIVLLQLKVLWGIWWVRDIPSGDTAVYFWEANNWLTKGTTVLSWSPLYMAYYGTVLAFFHDAFATTIAHRIIIVLSTTVLTLAICRRTLPHPLAWFLAAWWAILPINFDSLYEVHMFAAVPILAAALAAFAFPGVWGRGICLAALVASSALVRNEMFIGAIAFGTFAIGLDLWRSRSGGRQNRVSALYAYGIPLFVCLFLIGFFITTGSDREKYGAMMREKHKLNFCEAFELGYKQMHPETGGDCWKLMEDLFGNRKPTFFEALERNPRPVLEGIAWNVKLIPSGLQLALFNGISGSQNPDWGSIVTNAKYPFWLSIVLLCLVATGSYSIWTSRSTWWRERVWPLIDGYAALISIMIVGVFSMLTQRPRPAYFFGFTIALLVFIGLCIEAVIRKYPISFGRRLAVLGAVLLILLVPSPYGVARPRPVYTHYARLAPFAELFKKPSTVLVSDTYQFELCSYVGPGTCTPLKLSAFASPPYSGLERELDTRKATLLYVDDNLARVPSFLSVLDHLELSGWREVASVDNRDSCWRLLQRSSRDERAWDIVPTDGRVSLGENWYPMEQIGNDMFHWVNNDPVLVIKGNSEKSMLKFEAEAGPGVGARLFTITVFDKAGQKIASGQVRTRTWVEVPLPASPGPQTIRLHTDEGGQSIPNDPRILNFRVFRVILGPAAKQ